MDDKTGLSPSSAYHSTDQIYIKPWQSWLNFDVNEIIIGIVFDLTVSDYTAAVIVA